MTWLLSQSHPGITWLGLSTWHVGRLAFLQGPDGVPETRRSAAPLQERCTEPQATCFPREPEANGGSEEGPQLAARSTPQR